MLSLIVLPWIVVHDVTLVLSYSTQKFVEIECHLHGYKNRSTFQNSDHAVVLADIDDVTMTLSLIVLSRILFHEFTLVLSYSIPKLLRLNVIFMVRNIGKKKVHGRGGLPPPPPSTLRLSNFRPKTAGPIRKIFWWKDVPRMRRQLKILFEIKAFPIPEKTGETCWVGGGVASTPLGFGGLRKSSQNCENLVPVLFILTNHWYGVSFLLRWGSPAKESCRKDKNFVGALAWRIPKIFYIVSLAIITCSAPFPLYLWPYNYPETILIAIHYSLVGNQLFLSKAYGGPQGSHQNKNHCTNKQQSMIKIIRYKLPQIKKMLKQKNKYYKNKYMCTNDIRLFSKFLASILQFSSCNKKLPTLVAKRKLALLQLRKLLQKRKVAENNNLLQLK